MKVLSIDDFSLMRKIIRSAVDGLGYEFLEADSGQKAIDFLSVFHKEIVLVLLDWNLPDKDGLTILREIKADERFETIPVIMVTSEREEEKIIDAIESGASHYVTKPFTHDDLTKKMLEAIGRG